MAWNINDADYNSILKDISGQVGAGYGLFFKPDGLRMFVCDSGGSVYQYTLSIAWDISSASYDSVSKDVTAQEGQPRGIFFKEDGLKMYIMGSTGDAVWQYTLSSAWVVSSATYASKTISVAGLDTVPTGLFFKDDGSKMYVCGASSDAIHQYSLSTPWDLATATSDSVSLSVSSQTAIPRGIFFGDSGTKVFVVGFDSGAGTTTIYRYTLSTPWVMSSGSYDSISFAVTQDGNSLTVSFKPDGSKMYVVGSTDDDIYEYDLPSSSAIKTMQGLAIASVKTVQGLAIASVKSKNGLA